MGRYMEQFRLDQKVCVITGGAGLLGRRHAQAVLEGNGIPVLLDISHAGLLDARAELLREYQGQTVEVFEADITKKEDLIQVREQICERYGGIYGLVNNAANNPKVEGGAENLGAMRFTGFPLELWNNDIAVGLTGAMVCCQVFGEVMEKQNKGVIVNIGSDYGIIAPDQRIYRREGLPEEAQIIKPASYSVVKHGMIGLTKYLAVYWAAKGIRVNTLCPASLENGQDLEFVHRLSNLIPMGRMSRPEEFVCTLLYMMSEASSYMTGATVLLDGGRTSW